MPKSAGPAWVANLPLAKDTAADVTSLMAFAVLLERPTLEVESPTDPG